MNDFLIAEKDRSEEIIKRHALDFLGASPFLIRGSLPAERLFLYDASSPFLKKEPQGRSLTPIGTVVRSYIRERVSTSRRFMMLGFVCGIGIIPAAALSVGGALLLGCGAAASYKKGRDGYKDMVNNLICLKADIAECNSKIRETSSLEKKEVATYRASRLFKKNLNWSLRQV